MKSTENNYNQNAQNDLEQNHCPNEENINVTDDDNASLDADDEQSEVSAEIDDSIEPLEKGEYKLSKQALKFVGTYEMTDKSGQVWTIKLNKDCSARITVAGSRKVYYASWDQALFANMAEIMFDDRQPEFAFTSGVETPWQPVICGKYFYYSKISADAHNPRRRLLITKIS